jgi:hypothetical protein
MKAEGFLVVLGLDSEKKPHAARFDLIDEAAVRKAASHKGFSIGRAKTKEAVELAGKLIEGRIFDSGRGLVPFVSMEVFGKLKTLLEIEAVSVPVDAAAPSPVAPGDKTPDTKTAKGASPKKAIAASVSAWDAVKPGSLVLCQDDHKVRAWWECVVVSEDKGTGKLMVRWEKYPKLKPFVVRRQDVALIGPLAAKQSATIKAKATVLCRADNEKPPAWWESTVLSVGQDGTLKVCWREWPEHGSFHVKRQKIGILPPSTTAKATRK